MLPLVVNTGTDTFELVRLVALSIGLISVLVFLFTAAGSHLPRKGTIWHHEPATATGVDAAEKGDTKRLLLEKVSYDLQKRAILHKVRQYLFLFLLSSICSFIKDSLMCVYYIYDISISICLLYINIYLSDPT